MAEKGKITGFILSCMYVTSTLAQKNYTGSFAGSSFNCPQLSSVTVIPTSVHRLRPSDIKVIASMGDSLTSGFTILAESFVIDGVDYRGRAWSGGV